MEQRITTYTHTLLTVFVAAVLFSACVKRELEHRSGTTGRVQITFGWPGGGQPAAARLLFYTATGELHSEHDALTDSYTGILPAGGYRLILHNTDVSHAVFRSMHHYETATSYVPSFSGEGTRFPEAGDTLAEPGKIYAAAQTDRGTDFTVRPGKTIQLRVTPQRLTRRIGFLFKVTGLEAVRLLKGMLDGVSPSISISDRKCSPVPCRMLFTGSPYTAPKSTTAPTPAPGSGEVLYQSGMEVFGLLTHSDSPAGTNTLEMTVTGGNGKNYPLTLDITPVLQELIATSGGVLPLEIPLEVTIDINPVTTEINATVTPWDESGSGGGSFG